MVIRCIIIGFISLNTLFAQAQETIDGFDCAQAVLDRITSEPRNVLMYEVARIQDALTLCTRKRSRRGKEQYLYTWGHKDKLNDMLSMDWLAFCAKDQARLLTGIGVNYDRTFAALNKRNADIDTALHKIIHNSFDVPSKGYYSDIQEQSLKKMTETFQKKKTACDGNTLCESHYEGRLTALKVFSTSDKPRLNTSTFGTGVSFSTDPITFANHYLSEDHRALVCHIGSTNLQVTDLYSGQTQRAFEVSGIYIPIDEKDPARRALRSIFPFVQPLAYTLATHNHLLRVKSSAPVYLDRCSIDYKASCDYMRVSTMNDCRTLKLLRRRLSALLKSGISKGIQNRDLTNVAYYLIQNHTFKQGEAGSTADLLDVVKDRYQRACR